MMNQLMEALERQELDLEITSFTNEDAWQVGTILRGKVSAYGGDAAIDISAYGMSLFHCNVGRPTPNNESWIRRKRNTVLEFWKSSYRVTVGYEGNPDALESRGLSTKDYVLSGGGFPLRLKGAGVIGTIVVSGLPQTHDHQFIVDSLAEYLKVATVSILQDPAV
jgi:uncharacterized protein (UPF0303 family)